MELKTLPFYVLTYLELNHLVNYTWHDWNKKFDCASIFNWSNDTDHVVLDVRPYIFKDFPDKFESHRYHTLSLWQAGKIPHGDGLPNLLDGLCTHGGIPPGNYIIRISR